MSRPYLAFDLEIAKSFPDRVDDWKAYRPLGITCAATYSGFGEPTLWYNRLPDGTAGPRMTQDDLVLLVVFLEEAVKEGYTLLTWNGLGFDMDIMAEESGLHERCARLAWDHLDMMFHVFCLRGHPLALENAARGMGLPGKMAGMSGDLAPRYWAEGKWQIVLDYVAQDVRATLTLARTVEERKALSWISRKGLHQSLPLTDGWLTCRQAVQLPLPDVSWMPSPWPRRRFFQWLVPPG